MSPILLKKSDLAQRRNFACPLNRIAHLRHEGIEAYAENLAQEPYSAFAPASNEIAPLQIQFDENQAQSHKRVFQQYPPKVAVRVAPLEREERQKCDAADCWAAHGAHYPARFLLRVDDFDR